MNKPFYKTDYGELYHGDCFDIMPTIRQQSIDLICADLPYGTTQCKWDTILPFEKLWEEYSRIIKPNGAIVLFGTEPFSSHLRLSNLKDFKYDWIWDKVKGTGFLNAKKQPMRNHEIISVFYKKPCTYNPQKTTGHTKKQSFRGKHHQTDVYGEMANDYFYSSTERYPRSIQVFSTDTQNSSLHPTQKPLALLEYLIKTYTNEGDLVLDNTAGSCTLGLAAEKLQRHWICIEKEQEYCEKGKNRLEVYKTIPNAMYMGDGYVTFSKEDLCKN